MKESLTDLNLQKGDRVTIAYNDSNRYPANYIPIMVTYISRAAVSFYEVPILGEKGNLRFYRSGEQAHLPIKLVTYHPMHDESIRALPMAAFLRFMLNAKLVPDDVVDAMADILRQYLNAEMNRAEKSIAKFAAKFAAKREKEKIET